jgi:hypothetical protein
LMVVGVGVGGFGGKLGWWLKVLFESLVID